MTCVTQRMERQVMVNIVSWYQTTTHTRKRSVVSRLLQRQAIKLKLVLMVAETTAGSLVWWRNSTSIMAKWIPLVPVRATWTKRVRTSQEVCFITRNAWIKQCHAPRNRILILQSFTSLGSVRKLLKKPIAQIVSVWLNLDSALKIGWIWYRTRPRHLEMILVKVKVPFSCTYLTIAREIYNAL